MFGRKTGFFAVMAVALMLFGGCGTDGTIDENQARNWYDEMQGNGTITHHTDTGGSGVTGGNNLERNTYGMRTDGYDSTNADTTLGQDIRNAWDNVKDSVTGNNNAGGSTGRNR